MLMMDGSSPGEGANIDWARYEGLSFEAFRRLALDPSLSESEKIGFPDALREGAEGRILETMSAKLGLESGTELVVIDIGSGCGLLARRLVELCHERGHELVLVDSPEMLGQLPDDANVHKVRGRFPDVAPLLDDYAGRADAVIVYSVLHYVFVEGSVWEFVDAALSLLSPGGALLIGDVPNISKRKRFFASERGAAFHRAFMGTDGGPETQFNSFDRGKIDDDVLLGLIARARAQGFDAYLLPQPDDLPLANRREDVLIRRP
jgi:cyclopropane fatty-acyl-phospholipid synthase-like methyltransferase